MRSLRFGTLLLLVALATAAQTSPTDQAVIEFAKNAVPRALDYEQGNRASLMDAQADFTSEGWDEFKKWLGEYVDDKGVPLSSSVFTAAGEPVLKSRANGGIQLAVPGTLKQQNKISAGTYRVTVEVDVAVNPLKIRHLKTITCGAQPCK